MRTLRLGSSCTWEVNRRTTGSRPALFETSGCLCGRFTPGELSGFDAGQRRVYLLVLPDGTRYAVFCEDAKDDAVRIVPPCGIKWTGDEPLMFYYQERLIDLDTEAGVIPIHRFAPVEATIEIRDFDDESYLQQVRLLAEDAINQGGVTGLQLVKARLDSLGS